MMLSLDVFGLWLVTVLWVLALYQLIRAIMTTGTRITSLMIVTVFLVAVRSVLFILFDTFDITDRFIMDTTRWILNVTIPTLFIIMFDRYIKYIKSKG